MSTKRIGRIIPALTARTQFGQILRRAGQNQERFVVEKRGEPGVIMGVREYLRNFVKPGLGVDEIHEYVRKKNLKPLGMRAVDKEIKRHRNERSQEKAEWLRRSSIQTSLSRVCEILKGTRQAF